MPETAMDVATSGKLYLYDGYYTVGSDQVTQNNEYDFYSSDDNDYYIGVMGGIQDISYWSSTFSSPMLVGIMSQTDATINIEGTVEHTATNGYSNIYFYKDITDATCTINGDSLILKKNTSYDEVYGIKGNSGFDMSGQSIVFNIDYLDIESGTDNSIGYTGDGIFGNLTINDGCVLTATGSVNASEIVIGKASVKSAGLNVTAVNTEGESVYCVTVPNNGTKTIKVTDNSTSTEQTYSFEAMHPDDDNYYIYLPNGDYTLTTNSTDYSATVVDADVTATLAAIEGDGSIDVADGDVSIYEGGYQVGSQPYTYSGNEYTFTGTTTTNTITITGGAQTVYLNGVSIDVSSGSYCALNINTGSDLTIVLNDGTTNTLVSGDVYAGLQKSQTDGMLTILGKGTLNATGGSDCAPGIGNEKHEDFSNLTIENGVINAYASDGYASAIGAGHDGTTSNIYIKGGTITASVVCIDYAIGTLAGNENIVISGGFLNLYAGETNLTTYLLPSDITITGGTITGNNACTGDYYKLFASGTVITGGSVNLLDSDGEVTIEDDDRPTDGAETASYLYRCQYKIPGITTVTKVTSIVLDGETSWGCDSVYTDENGIVYLWLPQDDASAYEMTKVVITVNGTGYTYNGEIDAMDELVEESESVDASGNYFYQVPVSISTEHASVVVEDYDGNSITDGCYITSGLLDDNKVRFTISATSDAGYDDPVITVDNAEEGSVYYTVTADDDETLSISAVSSFTTGIEKTESDNIWASISDKNVVVHNAIDCDITIYSLSGSVVYACIASSNDEYCAVGQKGLYLVKVSGGDLVESQNFKCVVK